jgi:hypothetical protein
VARPVFKTATEAPCAAPVGSIPTRSRPRLLTVALLLLAVAGPLGAQDSIAVEVDSARNDTVAVDTTTGAAGLAADTVAVPDSLTVHRVAPFGAFFRSLILPGWGQLRVGRKTTAALFVVTEGITLGMSIKASRDVSNLRSAGADSAAIAAKKRTREDWYVLLAVNHLLAGLEAFIAAQLLDFPAELKIERSPGRVDAGFAVPIRFP